MPAPLVIRETADRAELREFLARDPVRAAYLLGDLAEPFFSHTRWLVADYRGRLEGVVLIYGGFATPVVLSLGAPDAVAGVLANHPEVTATPCAAKIPLEHQAIFAARSRRLDVEILWNMGVTQRDFLPSPGAAAAEPLGAATPAADVERIYADYPGNFFDPSQLASGLYYGLRVGGELVTVAGTHVLAPDERVAVLGNIVTAVQARGQGLARACTGALVSALFGRGCEVVALQVAAENPAAIAVYRALGFSYYGLVLQARLEPPTSRS